VPRAFTPPTGSQAVHSRPYLCIAAAAVVSYIGIMDIYASAVPAACVLSIQWLSCPIAHIECRDCRVEATAMAASTGTTLILLDIFCLFQTTTGAVRAGRQNKMPQKRRGIGSDFRHNPRRESNAESNSWNIPHHGAKPGSAEWPRPSSRALDSPYSRALTHSQSRSGVSRICPGSRYGRVMLIVPALFVHHSCNTDCS